MNASGFIASRLKFQGKLAVAAVAVSFLVIIVSISISSGFRHTIRDGVASIAGDITIVRNSSSSTLEDDPIVSELPSRSDIAGLPGVVSIRPVVQRPAIIRSGGVIHGVMVKGVEGRADTLSGVSIPSRLASLTGLSAGDEMVTYFVGERLKVRKFRVLDVYSDNIAPDEKLIVYAPIEAMRRVQGWGPDEASALEVELHPSFRIAGAMEGLRQRVGAILAGSPHPEENILLASSSRTRYPQLFDWLSLLDFNVLAILLLMTAVAGFNMVSGLLIVLLRNISTIGILKTLGMTDRAIAKVFLKVSSGVVLKGILIGAGTALGLCLIQMFTHVVKLNPANYYVSFVPVHIDLPFIIAATVLAYIAIMLVLLLPTLYISRIDPASTVRSL